MSRQNYSTYSLYEICALDRKLLCFYPDHFIYTDNEKKGDSKTHLSGFKFNLSYINRGEHFTLLIDKPEMKIYHLKQNVETTEGRETDRTIRNDTNLNAEQTETHRAV